MGLEAVGRAVARRERVDVVQCALESSALFMKQRRVRIVGGGEMRIDGIERQVRTGEQLGQRAGEIVEPEPEPVHAGVDFQVIAHPLLVPRRCRLHGTCRSRCRDGRRQPAIEQAIEIADAQRAEDQNLRAHSRIAQHRAFFDVRACHEIRSGVLERAGNLSCAVAVRVGFHHRNQAGRAIASLTGQVLDNAAVVRLEGTQVDSGDSRTNHVNPIAFRC